MLQEFASAGPSSRLPRDRPGHQIYLGNDVRWPAPSHKRRPPVYLFQSAPTAEARAQRPAALLHARVMKYAGGSPFGPPLAGPRSGHRPVALAQARHDRGREA